MEQQAPKVTVDREGLQHGYANGVNIIPMVDDCLVDFGMTSIALPPEAIGGQMTPELQEKVEVGFRHGYRIYMNWPTLKRFAIQAMQVVSAHEQAFGEIKLAEHATPEQSS